MKQIQIPKKLIPEGFQESNYSGVFLVFITGKSVKHVEKKTEQIKKLNEQWWSEICSGSRRDQISFPVVFEGVVRYIPKVHPFNNKWFSRRGHLK